MMVKVFLFARNHFIGHRVRAMWPEQENTSSSFRGVNQPVYRIECIIKDLYTYRNSTEGQTPFETNKPGSGRKGFFFFFFGGGAAALHKGNNMGQTPLETKNPGSGRKSLFF